MPRKARGVGLTFISTFSPFFTKGYPDNDDDYHHHGERNTRGHRDDPYERDYRNARHDPYPHSSRYPHIEEEDWKCLEVNIVPRAGSLDCENLSMSHLV